MFQNPLFLHLDTMLTDNNDIYKNRQITSINKIIPIGECK